MTPRRAILLCNPASIKADGRPLGGRPVWSPADAAGVFAGVREDDFSCFAYRWGGWDSEHGRCMDALLALWASLRDDPVAAMPREGGKAERLCELILREERVALTAIEKARWMGCQRRYWYRRWTAPYKVLGQAFELMVSRAERRAWRNLREDR